MQALSVWYEMCIFAISLVIASSSMITFVNVVSEPILSYTNEKTAFDTDDVVSWANDAVNTSNQRYGKDLLLALLNTDEYNCYPNAIKIDNSPIFKITDGFFTKKITYLQQIYKVDGDYKLGAKLNVKIKASRLEQAADGTHYMHYYLSTNPPS